MAHGVESLHVAAPSPVAGPGDGGPTPKDARVYYASYGSNLCRDRFLCYLLGGAVPGMRSACRGSRTPVEPAHHTVLEVPFRIVFAGRTTFWGGGGAAYLDLATPAADAERSLLRLYDVTLEQFNDVMAQENGAVPGTFREISLADLADLADRGPGATLAITDKSCVGTRSRRATQVLGRSNAGAPSQNARSSPCPSCPSPAGTEPSSFSVVWTASRSSASRAIRQPSARDWKSHHPPLRTLKSSTRGCVSVDSLKTLPTPTSFDAWKHPSEARSGARERSDTCQTKEERVRDVSERMGMRER